LSNATFAGPAIFASGGRLHRPDPRAATNEPGALLVAAGRGSPAEHALISLLAVGGLRLSEAAGTGIRDVRVKRGRRTRPPGDGT